jgi:7-carboxy-7-deazaguanine synthase
VATYDCPLVEVTGGEPLLQPDALLLMQALVDRGFEVLLETGGSLRSRRSRKGVKRIVDVKVPGQRGVRAQSLGQSCCASRR